MSFEEILPFLNEISNVLRGRDIQTGPNRRYEDDLDNLIESVGFYEFFKSANIELKIEFLFSCNNSNFEKLINLINNDDFLSVIVYSEVSELREILRKLLSINSESSFYYWDFIDSVVNGNNVNLHENKRVLLKGYRDEYLRKNENHKIPKNESEDRVKQSFEKLLLDHEELKKQYSETIFELNSHIDDLEEKNKQNIQIRIDENLSDYVEKSVAALNGIEGKLKCAAARWSMLSVCILFSGFTAGIGFSLFGYAFGPDLAKLRWPELLIFSIKGIFIVSAFVAAAGYSFMKSNAFTHEAIIVSNRAHAIQFGKLYLEIYGNTVERSEMQKIFENWNISSDTAFLKHKNDKSESVKFSELLDSLKKVKDLIPVVGKD